MQINQKFHFKIRDLLTSNLQEDIDNKINFNNLSLNSSELRIFETELINFLKFNDCEKIIRKEIERKTLYNSGTIQINSKDNPISRKDLITAYELTTKKTFINTSLLENFNSNSQKVLSKAIEISIERNCKQLIKLENKLKEFNINSSDLNYLDNLIEKKSIFKDVEMSFLEFPEEFTKEDLLKFLKNNSFHKYFSKENYKIFLSNSFKLFSKTEFPLVLNLPLTKEAKKEIPEKLYELFYKFKSLKKENPDLDLSKENYGLLLMRNFSDFRKSSGYQYSFDQILQNTTKMVRRKKRFST